MSTASEHIDHVGIISAIKAGKAQIRLIGQDACNSCRMREFCGVDDESRSLYYVPVKNRDLHVGDEVKVIISPQMGYAATFWGYVLPFLLILATLLVSLAAGLSEMMAGVISLAVLPAYYVGLTLFRAGLTKKLTLEIVKR